jgi:Cu+-exporting ATPase
MLADNELCDFYLYNDNPGVSLNRNKRKHLEFLDDITVQDKFILFNNGKMANTTLSVPGIHCSSCIYLLEHLYKFNKGIMRVSVNFLRKEVHVSFNPEQTTLRQIAELLSNIGYEPAFNLQQLDDASEQATGLSVYYIKIAVAFFCFGNIMLLSFPEYLGLDILAESGYRKFFGYLNFALALPVMFYCAEEFFRSAWAAIRQKTLNMDIPIVLGMVVMFVRSSIEIFTNTGAGYFDTLASLTLLMLVGRMFQQRTYHNLNFDRNYKSYFPVSVSRKVNDTEENISIQKLEVGDVIVIRNSELIPADGILRRGAGSIDYSFVTGESAPLSRSIGQNLFAGGKHIGAAIEVEITKAVSQSYLTQLWNDMAFHKTGNKQLSTMAGRVSRWFTPLVIWIAIAAAAYWWNTDTWKAWNAFTAVLIITCPCALALSSPFTLGNAIRLLAKAGFYLKNGNVVETLSTVDTVVFDKTGTLTNPHEAAISYEGEALTGFELKLVRSLAYHSSHPLSKKLYRHLADYALFESRHTNELEGKGMEGWIEEHFVRIGSKPFVTGEASVSNQFFDRHASRVYIGIEGAVKGYFTIKNEYRKGFGRLMGALKIQYDVYVLSGDNSAERNFLKQYLPGENLVFDQSPAGKLAFIQSLQGKGKKVLMVGDGLNDAGALKQSNAGIVIADDVNNFSPACDGIVNASRFEFLSRLLHYSKQSRRIIMGSFIISLLYNAAGIYLAVQGTMSPLMAAILMPVSSVTIISFTTLFSRYVFSRNGFPMEEND